MMKLINEVLSELDTEYAQDERWGWLLAEALLSSCLRTVSGPNLLGVSVNLNDKQKELFFRLCCITQEPDYSNADQEAATEFLRKKWAPICTTEYKRA